MMDLGGELLAVQERDGTTKILDVKTGELMSVLHSDGALIGFSPDGKRFYSVDNNSLKAWNLSSDRGKILVAHSGPVTSVVFGADGDRLASSGDDKTVKIWNTQTGEQFAILTRDQKIQGLIGFDPQRQRLGSFESQGDGIVYNILNTSTGKEIAATPYNSLHSTRAVASTVDSLSPDGRVLAMEKEAGVVTIHNLETGQELTLGSLNADRRGYDVLGFSGDSRQLAGAIDGTVKIWDLETGKESLVLNSGKEIQALYFSVDKKRLALVMGNFVEIWDTSARKPIATISRITGRVSLGVFSPDGRWFAASVDSQRIKLWDTETGRLIQTFSPGTLVSSFIFSPDGKWLVSGAQDLRLWSLEEKNPEAGFVLPGSGGSNAAFDRAQRWLAYGGRDGRVRLWNFETLKHSYAADSWALLKEVHAATNRKVAGLDFDFLSQFQLRDVLGDKYNPFYSLVSLSEGNNASDLERDNQAELRENSPRSQPTHGGSISGTIDFRGERPQPKRIDTSADSVCSAMNPNLTTEDWIVTDGKLANVFVYVKSGSRLENYIFDTPTSEAVLEHKNCRSIPHLLGMQVHQALKLLNSDPTMHNYHIIPKNNPEWNQTMPQGGSPLYHEFDRKETFIPVKDNQHPWEKSYIGVFSNPFFAVSAKDGSYTITGLPPGRYTIVAWHEGGATGSEQSFEVTIGSGESKTINFTFSKP
jgi:WD40 repeat protein